jgi:hypothetical protein
MMYDHEKSDPAIVCAGQRMSQEGSSPSGARMRSAVSKGGGNASPASGESRWKTGCQIASKCDPLFAAKNDPFDGAETGGAEPHIAEQSRSWRAASGERAVMRGF